MSLKVGGLASTATHDASSTCPRSLQMYQYVFSCTGKPTTFDVEAPIQSTSKSDTNGNCQMATGNCTTFEQALLPFPSTRMASPTTSTALALHFLKMIDMLMMTNIMKNVEAPHQPDRHADDDQHHEERWSTTSTWRIRTRAWEPPYFYYKPRWHHDWWRQIPWTTSTIWRKWSTCDHHQKLAIDLVEVDLQETQEGGSSSGRCRPCPHLAQLLHVVVCCSCPSQCTVSLLSVVGQSLLGCIQWIPWFFCCVLGGRDRLDVLRRCSKKNNSMPNPVDVGVRPMLSRFSHDDSGWSSPLGFRWRSSWCVTPVVAKVTRLK